MIRFRVWDGRTMHYPEDRPENFLLAMDGQIKVIGSGNVYMIPMLSTSLHDKNGREIFEGDVLETPTGKFRKKVCFSSGGFFFGETGTLVDEWLEDGTYCIGNIYENPEMEVEA